MTYHYVWLWWSLACLVPWLVLYLANPQLRTVMWRVSLGTERYFCVVSVSAGTGLACTSISQGA